MRPFQDRVARIALRATEPFGFVLAGGYAVSLHGIGDRLSHDMDLFTNVPEERAFAGAREALKAALAAAGLVVTVERSDRLFFDALITDPQTNDTDHLQLGYDYRKYDPDVLAIGPVLDVRDAVGNKMSALYGRAFPRDGIDILNAIASGRFTRQELLELGDERETNPMDRHRLVDSLRRVMQYPDEAFVRQGGSPGARDRIIAEFSEWIYDIETKMNT
ncbi:MAG: nucleotidyl transferase AbiEii/AbiGii toxin family protein [Propionibacteriaceae bacterium]|jgi:hypothetical protein|nr:nucleotidyl transferase AbiEii/AbiGii toxin family protein [Propionibacteriaceae bacterium]